MKNKSRKKIYSAGFLIIFLACVYCLFCPVASAETNFGDLSAGELLQFYLEVDDKAAADEQLTTFVMGWIDGLRSVYFFEGVFAGTDYPALADCSAEHGYEEVAQMLLQAGAEPKFSEVSVSNLLWASVHNISCGELFGVAD